MYSIKDKISIGFGGRMLSVKKEFFDFIWKNYFKARMKGDECKIRRNEVYEILCDEEFDSESFGELGVIIGKWRYKIRNEKLFFEIENQGRQRKWFAVVYYPEYNEYYMSQFMLTSATIVYNREEDYVGIYQ